MIYRAAYWIAVLSTLLILGAVEVEDRGGPSGPSEAAAASDAPAPPASEAERRAASWEKVREARRAMDSAWDI